MVTEACVASGGELRDIVGGIDAMHLRRASARPIVQPLKPYPDYFPLPRQSHIASRIGQYRAVMFSVDIMMTAPSSIERRVRPAAQDLSRIFSTKERRVAVGRAVGKARTTWRQ